MWTLVSIAVGFLVVSVGVAALARSTTARWERERRKTERVRRPAAEPPPTPRTKVAVRLGRALATARVARHRGALQVRRVRRVPQLGAALRYVHGEHRRPAQLAARVVHRRDPRRATRTTDEHTEPAP